MKVLHRLKSKQHSDSKTESNDAGMDAAEANERLEAAFESMSSLIFSADEKELRDV